MKDRIEHIRRRILSEPLPPVDAGLREFLDNAELRDSVRAEHIKRIQQQRPPYGMRMVNGLRRQKDNIFSLGFVGVLLLAAVAVLDAPKLKDKQQNVLSQDEQLDLREQVLGDPDTLKALGYCARELEAQETYDQNTGTLDATTSAEYVAANRIYKQDKTAKSLAKIYNISCDAQVPTVTVQTETVGTQEVWPGTFVVYDQTLWCGQRLAAINNIDFMPEKRLAYVDAGDRVFGSRGRFCSDSTTSN